MPVGFHGYVEVDDFSCHPSHWNLSSVHLPVFLVMVLSFFIHKLPPCLSKHLLGILLSQALVLKLYEFFSLFLKSFGTAGTFFSLLFCTLHFSSWKRAEVQNFYVCKQAYLSLCEAFGSRIWVYLVWRWICFKFGCYCTSGFKFLVCD